MAPNPFRTFAEDPRYLLGTISFTTVVPYDPQDRDPTETLRQMVCTGIIFNPLFTFEDLRSYLLRPLVSLGRRAIVEGIEYRIVHVTVRGRSVEPVPANEALNVLEKAVPGILAVSDWVANEYEGPLPAGISSVGDLGFPINTVTGLKMALETLKIHVARNGGPDHEGLCGTTIIKAPRDFKLLKTGVFTKRDLKNTLPEPLLSRFFSETPEVCAIKTAKNPFSHEVWCMSLGAETPTPEPGQPRNPHSLEDWAKLGVMKNCLVMSRRGIGHRFHPYHSL